jgi:outer membrane lipoprotein-sorting protein
MSYRQTALVLFLGLYYSLSTQALTPTEVVQKAQEKYRSLTHYSASGTTVAIIDMSVQEEKPKDDAAGWNKPQRVTHSFSLRLARPSLYRIEWEQKLQPGFSNKGAVWSSGDGDFVLIGDSRYSKISNRDLALSTATGISGGAAHTIPAVFFDSSESLLKTLSNLTAQKDEAIAGDDCHVISGDVGGQKMILWISKKSFLIAQKQHILGGSVRRTEMSDEDIAKALKSLNKEATPEAIAQMRKTMEMAMAMTSKMKGTMTETHHDIILDAPVEKKEFEVKVPAGLKPTASPF